MMKLWDKKENIITPDGTEWTPEEVMAHPGWEFTRTLSTVLTTSGPVTIAIDNLYILQSVYGVPNGLSAEEALAAIIAAQSEVV